MLLEGRARPTGLRQRGVDATMLMVLNAAEGGVGFTLPECAGGEYWLRVIDTNLPDDAPEETTRTGEVYTATGHSLLLFALQAEK